MVDTSFKVSRQEYLELLDAILKKRRLSIINILAFLVMTVGQVALVTVNIVKYDIRGGQMALLIALSASICVIQLLYQFSTGLRARGKDKQRILGAAAAYTERRHTDSGLR